MIETATAFTYKLTAVYDLREIDEFTGERLPLEPGQGNICNRCGREHAKVYEVKREQDGREFTVGSTCCKKLFGWEPEREEARRLEKEAKKLAESRAHARLEAIAAPIAEEVRALDVPEIIFLGTKYSMQVPCYGMADSRVEVCCHDGLTDERRECCVRAWKNEQIEKRAEALYPHTAIPMSEDANWRKRYKVERMVRSMLEMW